MSEPRELKPVILFGDHEQSDPSIKDFRPRAAPASPEPGEEKQLPPDEALESTGNEGAKTLAEDATSPWDEPPVA